MMIEYTYIKRRYQFGKQCIFKFDDSVAQETIWPDPHAMQKYCIDKTADCTEQISKQFAAHEVQTTSKRTKNTGMLHEEGSWPREINPRDNEAVYRYRRRVEKDDLWVSSMRKLIPKMKQCIRQNNAINIYTNYFDDMVPTPLRKQCEIRIRNSYEDPQANVRPIRALSWSHDNTNRLAAAYSFAEFEEHPPDVNPYSYVWDIENPIAPLIALKSSSPMPAVEFNPRDPSMLVSGLTTGQVCSWDIRTGDKPMQTSLPFFSHSYPVTQTLWISSKANTEFFSSALDGTVKWWDIRFMRKPTDTLVMDLDNPERMDRFKAAGITALQFEHTISSKFLAGLENGMVVFANKRGDRPSEKLAMRFECHTGPVIAVDRNHGLVKNFLTIGDWTAKVWSDDTREGCLLSTSDANINLSGGCWSKSRCSVFFTINTSGLLEAYDILAGVQRPLTSIHISSRSLTAISAHDDGALLAVGNSNGSVYMLECKEGLTMISKEDKSLLNTYFEQCSRFQRTLATRLKETQVLQDVQSKGPVRRRKSKSKGRRKDTSKDRTKSKSLGRESAASKDRKKSKGSSEKVEKRSKSRRSKKATLASEPELVAAEENYFRMVEAELEKVEDIDPADVSAATELLLKKVVTSVKEEGKGPKMEDTKSLERSRSTRIKRTRSRVTRRKRATAKSDDTDSERRRSTIHDGDSDFLKEKAKKRVKILKTCPMEVCKPEICCKDVLEKIRSKRLKRMKMLDDAKEVPKLLKPFRVGSKWFDEISKYTDQVPEQSLEYKRKMMALKELPPNVLQEVLQDAKKEIRAWQEQVLAGKLSFRTVQKKIEDKTAEQPEVTIEDKTEPVKRRVSVGEEMARHRTGKEGPMRRKQSRRRRMTQKEIEQEEEAKKKEKWWRLKQRVKEFERKREVKGMYPRISAARRSSEDVENLGTK